MTLNPHQSAPPLSVLSVRHVLPVPPHDAQPTSGFLCLYCLYRTMPLNPPQSFHRQLRFPDRQCERKHKVQAGAPAGRKQEEGVGWGRGAGGPAVRVGVPTVMPALRPLL